MNNIVQLTQAQGGALSAEHYESFELAKEHDGVLGGDDIAQIRSYAAYARAQAQAIHKTIAATSGIEDVAAIKAEAVETEQTFAKVGLYADQRIGEILREMPKAKNQYDARSSDTQEEQTKASAIKDAGISRSQAYDLQAMASNPEVVQAVIDKATEEGRIPSRAQVLKAIKERDAALEEVAALEKQNDQLYEKAQAAKEPKVVERAIYPSDYADTKKRIRELEHLEQVHSSDNQKLRQHLNETRKELSRAKDLLGMDKTLQDVRKDVQYLISATNQYVRQYGGLTWTAQSLADVDEPTREELTKAVRNLVTFSNALMASLESFNADH